MNGAWLGFAAIVVFVLMLVLFFAAMALAPTGGTVGTLAVPAAASQPLVVPTVASSSGAASAAGAPASQSVTGQTGSISYTVQPGEWLSSIARDHSTTVPAILAANPQITDSNLLRPGQSIRIPTP